MLNYHKLQQEIINNKIPTVEESLKAKQEEAQKEKSERDEWQLNLQHSEVAQQILFKVREAQQEVLKKLEANYRWPSEELRVLSVQYGTLRAVEKAILTNTEVIEK